MGWGEKKMNEIIKRIFVDPNKPPDSWKGDLIIIVAYLLCMITILLIGFAVRPNG